MTWFWWALASALLVAGADFLTRRYFADLPPVEAILVRFGGALPLSLFVLVWYDLPPLPLEFWLTVALALPVELAASYLYVRALQVSPLGLSLPFLAFSPLFSTLTGAFFLGDLPSPAGLAGVGLVVVGAYGLNLHQARHGWAEPFRAIGREPGSWMILLVALCYAYTAVLGRKVVLMVGASALLGIYPVTIFLCWGVWALARRRLTWAWLGRPGPVLAMSLCMGGMVLTHFVAIGQVQAAYMLSVKRLSILAGALLGGLWLGEKRLGQTLAAAGLMVAGSVVILLWG